MLAKAKSLQGINACSLYLWRVKKLEGSICKDDEEKRLFIAIAFAFPANAFLKWRNSR
jgi:hypothetical protein